MNLNIGQSLTEGIASLLGLDVYDVMVLEIHDRVLESKVFKVDRMDSIVSIKSIKGNHKEYFESLLEVFELSY